MAIVLLAAAVPVALSVIPGRADAAASADAGSAALADLEGRSPGERLVGIAMKAARVVRETLGAPSEPEKRAERVLARPPAPPSQDDVVALQEPVVPIVPADIPESAGLPGQTDLNAGFPRYGGSSGGYFPVAGGGSSGGGSSGGGSSSGGNETTPTPPTPPVSAVPEPATWLMMILGFGFVGATMRRRPRKVRLPRAI